MKMNEEGSTLVMVLLVILVFLVIGVSVMGQVINERKLTVNSEEQMQARYLAQSGHTYFEKDFEEEIKKEEEFNLDNFIKEYNKEDEPVYAIGNENSLEKAVIVAVEEKEEDYPIIEVISKGIVNDDTEVTLVGEYELRDYVKEDIDERTEELADFNTEGTVAVNFATNSVLDIGVGDLLSAGLIHSSGINDYKFYIVPNDSLIDVDLLAELLKIDVGDGDRFEMMESRRVIATRSGRLLNLDLLDDTVRLSVLELQEQDDTNVLINGYYEALSLLGFIKLDGYRDIDFKKLAVIGSAIIQQEKKNRLFDKGDTAPRRYFSFNEGLYVKRSLIIGDEKNARESSLGLIGDMVTMENLLITDTNLKVSESNGSKYGRTKDLTIYVHGDVHINNSCVSLKNGDYDFRVITKGKITFENIEHCGTEYPGYYYAENGAKFIANDGKIYQQEGKVYGKVDLRQYKIVSDDFPSTKSNYELIPLGRRFEN